MSAARRTGRRARADRSAERVAAHIRIRKSTCGAAGGGAFTTVAIPSGTCVGFYAGRRRSGAECASLAGRDYCMRSGGGGAVRDGYDERGRLVLADGTEVNVHGWDAAAWAALEQDGVAWRGEDANWTRFLNHGSGAHRNLSLATTSARFGRSHCFYASRPIPAGEELFFHYGADYWKARGVVPEVPPPPPPSVRAATQGVQSGGARGRERQSNM